MVNKWNIHLESLILTMEKKSKLFKKIHMEISIDSYWKYSIYMNIATIISPLPGLISVLGTTLSKELSNMVYFNSSSAILSFFNAIIVAIIKFNKYDESGYDHRSASTKFTSLEQNIKRQLMLERNERVPVKDYISWVLKSYENLLSSSPTLPSDFFKKYEKEIDDLEKEFEKKELMFFEFENKNSIDDEQESKFTEYKQHSDEESKNYIINIGQQNKNKKKNVSIHDLSIYDDNQMKFDFMNK